MLLICKMGLTLVPALPARSVRSAEMMVLSTVKGGANGMLAAVSLLFSAAGLYLSGCGVG